MQCLAIRTKLSGLTLIVLLRVSVICCSLARTEGGWGAVRPAHDREKVLPREPPGTRDFALRRT